MEKKKRILVLASGTKTGGGSGFQELVEFTRTVPAILDAEIVAVVSNHEFGGVRKRADRLGIAFEYWAGPYDARGYQELVEKYQADYVMCSGWLKMVVSLDPRMVINIHPGILPKFGGKDYYGHIVHEATMRDHDSGGTKQSAVTMHFVTENYDLGPIFFEFPVLIRDIKEEKDSADSLGDRVNEKERAWQAYMLNLVVQGCISYIDEKTIEVDRGIWSALQQFIPAEKVNVTIRR